jgi:hypothetical protein
MYFRGAGYKARACHPQIQANDTKVCWLRHWWHSNRHAPRNTKERKMRSKIRWFTEFCNSHYLSHFAAFFIDARAKRSVAESCIIYCIKLHSIPTVTLGVCEERRGGKESPQKMFLQSSPNDPRKPSIYIHASRCTSRWVKMKNDESVHDCPQASDNSVMAFL